MTPIELHRLAGAVSCLRPDWPPASVQTFIAKHFTHRPLRDIAVALAYVAADPDSSTPARVLEAGPWWQAAATTDVPTTRNDCPTHPLHGLRVDPRTGEETCAGCWADDNADEHATATFDRRPRHATPDSATGETA